MSSIRILTSLLAGVFLLACDSNRVYEQYENIPDFEWSQKQVLRFEVEVEDTLQSHNLFLNVRNTGNYEYSNLWVFVKSISPDGIAEEVKVEVDLANDSGEWYGSGFGDIFDLQAPLKKNVHFPKSGTYVFELIQGMYDLKLKGIVSVGIRIEKKQ